MTQEEYNKIIADLKNSTFEIVGLKNFVETADIPYPHRVHLLRVIADQRSNLKRATEALARAKASEGVTSIPVLNIPVH